MVLLAGTATNGIIFNAYKFKEVRVLKNSLICNTTPETHKHATHDFSNTN
jgi:hypothetical protein